MHEEALDALAEIALLVGVDRGPPLLPRHADDPAAEALDRGELRLRGVVGDDDRGRHAKLAGHPGDALRHVSGARGDEPVRERVGRRVQDGVRGSAELERGDGLEVLELEPDLGGSVDAQPDERRAEDRAGDSLAGCLDLRERDQKGTSTPTPRSCARRSDELGGRQVLDGDPERLEHRELVLVLAPGVQCLRAPRRAPP